MGGGRRVGEAHPTTKTANEVSLADGARQRARYPKQPIDVVMIQVRSGDEL